MVDTLKAGPAPVELDTNVASVHLQDITFAADDLTLPLYPTLFDYNAAPSGLNLVPSFQVRNTATTRIDITLDLTEDEEHPFEIQSDLEVFWRVINGEANVIPSSVALTSCTLQIEPATLDVVLQVLCRRPGQTTFSGKEEIEGGLFLSIVNDPGPATVPVTTGQTPSVLADAIVIEGRDSHGRLKYNVFNGSVYTDPLIVSVDLEPELAFRVRWADSLDVTVSLEPAALVFVPREDHPLEVALTMREPSTRPEDLSVEFSLNLSSEPIPGGCTIHWPSSNDDLRRDYKVISFSMVVGEVTEAAQEFLKKKEKWDGKFDFDLLKPLARLIEDPEFRRLLAILGSSDPTIIDTPKCIEINGQTVCVEAT